MNDWLAADSDSLEEHIPPAVRLWAAVLRRAVVEFILYRDADDVRYRRIGENARTWLYDTSNTEFNSVTSVCLYVGITVDSLHRKLSGIDAEIVRRFRGMGLS